MIGSPATWSLTEWLALEYDASFGVEVPYVSPPPVRSWHARES